MPPSSPNEAGERLLRARITLALRQPFLASALMRLPLRDATDRAWCTTMATDGYHIYYDAGWVAKLTQPQLRGVLAHEVLHVVFQHTARRKDRDARLWNLAGDHAINLLLLEQGFVLPAGGAQSKGYIGMAAEDIYAKLSKACAASLVSGKAGSKGEGSDDGPGVVPGIGVDLLLGPDDPRAIGLRDADSPDDSQLKDLCAELRSDATSKLHGTSASWFKLECVAVEDSFIDWRALLREWLQDRIRSDWSLWPFSKKHIHRGFLLPSVGVEAPGHLIFAIDTSGSMSNETLGAVVAELRAYRETFPCRLTVIQADAAVQSVQCYEEMDGMEVPQRMTIQGRGGTDFRPVFAWAEQNAPGALVVYATDGYGTFPVEQPIGPVIWLLMKPHAAAAMVPFGACVSVAG